MKRWLCFISICIVAALGITAFSAKTPAMRSAYGAAVLAGCAFGTYLYLVTKFSQRIRRKTLGYYMLFCILLCGLPAATAVILVHTYILQVPLRASFIFTQGIPHIIGGCFWGYVLYDTHKVKTFWESRKKTPGDPLP